MGMAESLGVDAFFKKETWREAGEGLNMLVTQPGRAANVLKDEFQQRVATPLSLWGAEAVQNPAGAAAGLRDGVVSMATQAGQGIQDVAQKSALGLQLLVKHPGASMQVLGDSPRGLGNVFGVAAGVGLDMISGGSTRVARGSTQVGAEVAGTLAQQALRVTPPSPVMLADGVTPSAAVRSLDIAGASGSGPVSLVLSQADLVDGELRLGDIVGQSIIDVRLTLPTGQAPSVIAEHVASGASSYRDFLSPLGPPGSVDVQLGNLTHVEGIHIGEVVGGSKGTFEFNFAQGVEVPAQASPRPMVPLARPSVSDAPVQSGASIYFGEGRAYGDVLIGDVAGRSNIRITVEGGPLMNDALELDLALQDFRQTVRQHIDNLRTEPSSVSIHLGHGSSTPPDVIIGNVSNGNALDLRVRMPADTTAEEAAANIQGVREGLERLWSEVFSDTP